MLPAMGRLVVDYGLDSGVLHDGDVMDNLVWDDSAHLHMDFHRTVQGVFRKMEMEAFQKVFHIVVHFQFDSIPLKYYRSLFE